MWSPCFASVADASVVPQRFGHSACHVHAAAGAWGTDIVVVYGGVVAQRIPDGSTTSQRALGDVLLLQVDSGAWTAPDVITPASGGPGPRAFHCAAALDSRMMVFGGHILTLEGGRKKRVFFNDLWSLDVEDWQWQRVEVAASSPVPPKRDMAALLPLGDSRLLLFGGRSEQQRALNDCWVFDLGTESWTQLKHEGAVPPPRKMHALTLLPGPARCVVLFGGEKDNGLLDDLWVLQLHEQQQEHEEEEQEANEGSASRSSGSGFAHWTQLNIQGGPSPRFGHAMVALPNPPAYDGDNQQPDSAAAEEATPGATEEGEGTTGSAVKAPPLSPFLGRIALFGGCMDHSTFPYLARSYVQTSELWAADLGSLTWANLQPAPATGEHDGGRADETGEAQWPPERMCHTLTALGDGRALLLGGRWKEGICDDLWWFEPAKDMLLSALQPTGSSAPLLSSAAGFCKISGITTPTGSTSAAALVTPRPSASQGSLLQSLLQPLRPKEPPAVPAARGPTASQAGGAPVTYPPSSSSLTSPLGSQPGSPKHLSQASMDVSPALLQLGVAFSTDGARTAPGMQAGSSFAAAQLKPPRAASGAASPSAVVLPQPFLMSQQQALEHGNASQPGQPQVPPPQLLLPPMPPQQQQQQQQQWSRLAQLQAAGTGLLQATGSSDWGELRNVIRNPAAALSSLTARLGNQLQPGLEALSQRLGPSALLDYANMAAGGPLRPPSATAQQALPPLGALRAQMGLTPGGPTPSDTKGGLLYPAYDHMVGLVQLGQQLLGSSDGGADAFGNGLGTEVLVSAARQHLMAVEAEHLRMGHLQLLVADYAFLASEELERQLLHRLKEESRIPAPEVWPSDHFLCAVQSGSLKIADIGTMQRQYAQLLSTELAS